MVRYFGNSDHCTPLFCSTLLPKIFCPGGSLQFLAYVDDQHDVTADEDMIFVLRDFLAWNPLISGDR